jgi:hypothetical protein
MTRLSSPPHLMRAFALAASACVIVGCAPDAIKLDASGFNRYVKKIGQVCQPLQLGDKDVGEMIRLGDSSTAYDNFLDETSMLYYNRITPAAYRQALVAFFGPGTATDRSLDCITRNLPPQRPNAPY